MGEGEGNIIKVFKKLLWSFGTQIMTFLWLELAENGKGSFCLQNIEYSFNGTKALLPFCTFGLLFNPGT